MLAARAIGWGQDPVLEEIPTPEPGSGETLVEVAAAPCVHFDLSVMSGNFFANPDLPFTPGHEGTGKVVESATHAAGAAVRLRAGPVGLTRDGTWAQFVVVPDGELEPLSAAADLQLAAAYQSPCATAHAALRLVGNLQPGQSVAVTGGSGCVASVTAQLALRLGASRVVAFHRDPAQRDLIPAGVEAVVWTGSDCLAPFEGEDGFDLVVEVLGGDVLAQFATRATKPGGLVAVVGYAASEDLSIYIPDLLHANVTISPVNLIRLADAIPPSSELLAEVERGDLHLHTQAFPLTELPTALEMLRSGTAGGRVVLTP
ncbi:MAG: zinc-binding dehydrogenase [Actinobacteria bacterium]|nr:zinc-binding dehydrogenase [Actinomycetota bacterium]